MVAVILYVPAAVTANRYRNSRAVEELRLPLRVVEQTVMRRVEPAGYRERLFYVYGHPMPKNHTDFVQVAP